MASVTFGSVGDIIAICQIITTAIKSLSTSRGSDVEYRGLINELWSLAQALESIKSLLEEDTQIKHRGRLRIALQNCRECLERELESIRKFSSSLGKVGSAKSARDAFWKTRWLGHKTDLSVFRQAISSHTSSITLLLQASGIQISQLYHSETAAQFNEIGKRLREDFDSVQESQKRHCGGIKDSVQGLESALVTRNQELQSNIQTSRVATLGRIDKSHGVLLRIDNSSQQCLQGLQALKTFLGINEGIERSSIPGLNELLQKLERLLHRSIPGHLQKAPLVYEDALLRKFSIDLEFIPAYDIFLQVVGSHYKGTEGEAKIKKGEYAFEDKSQKALSLAGVWTSDILSGKSVFMRVTFDDIASPENQCPSCKSITKDTSIQTEIVCQNCKLQYLKCSARLTDRKIRDELSFPPSDRIPSSFTDGTMSESTQNPSAIGFFRRVQVQLTEKHSYLCLFPDCYTCSGRSESLNEHSDMDNITAQLDPRSTDSDSEDIEYYSFRRRNRSVQGGCCWRVGLRL